MEFKFRSVDDSPPPPPRPLPPLPPPQPPPFFSPSSSIGCFPTQLDRVNYPSAEPPMMMTPREVEKARIRAEIIAEEVARRRELEAEVRRELMMEREMAVRLAATAAAGGVAGGGGNLSFDQNWTMRFSPQLSHQIDNCWKHKLIMLANADPNRCSAKQKAAVPPEAEELPVAGIKKKPKEEWSCALCQVSATCKKGLNEHLQGRKHKAKEAALRAHNIAKNMNKLRLSNKAAKSVKLTGSKANLKIVKESLQVNESFRAPVGKTADNKSNKQLAKKTKLAKQPQKTGEAKVQKKGGTLKARKKKHAETTEDV